MRAVSRSKSVFQWDIPHTQSEMSRGGVALLTSGGDAPGMNAAVRAVVRYLCYKNITVYAVRDGYLGLVEDKICKLEWADVKGMMSHGGTKLGTARCAQFRTREGRKSAALHMINKRISNLIVIGGDGSLTGASIFRSEWEELHAELLQEGAVSAANAEVCSHLNIVGMVGSIDNDLCGTDMTIGADSALHRIVQACDCLASTAASHMRTFIVEVMGRHCGYLALMSALATPCDWLFIPESPPEEGWEERIVTKMNSARSDNKTFALIILAEGAHDVNGVPIKADHVKDILTKAGQDVRVTVLGHVQRGGQPTAFDRILGSRLGCEAAQAVIDASPDTESCIISLKANKIVKLPLLQAIRHTQEVKEAVSSHDFVRAQDLRGHSFRGRVELFDRLTTRDLAAVAEGTEQLRIGLLCVGAPAAGVNAGIRALVKLAAHDGNVVSIFYEGVDGLLQDNIETLSARDVETWVMRGGCKIGSSRTTINTTNMPIVQDKLAQHGISTLVIFGGFEALMSVLALSEQKIIPVYLIPATISNNVPGSDFSIGCDTALNAIVGCTDAIKQSAASTRKRVFIVDVMGGYCGYLAVMGAIASGADCAYIAEQPVNIDQLQYDAHRLINKMDNQDVYRGLIIRNERSSPNYSNDFVTALYAEEGRGKFIARSAVLGHIQQGYSPSPFDRCLAAHMAAKVYKAMQSRTYTLETAVVLGVSGAQSVFTPVQDLLPTLDMVRRMSNNPTSWWMDLKPIVQILSLPPEKRERRTSIIMN